MMTVKEAAAVLRLSDQTIWRYIRAGKLTARKVGRQYLIATEEVTAQGVAPDRELPPGGDKAPA